LKDKKMTDTPSSQPKAQAVAPAQGHALATADYIKDMAQELAKLANSAGYDRLSQLLTLAAQEAWLCQSFEPMSTKSH
jgi:hypothetical protein